MVFTPVRTEREPSGTDRVPNWAAYGLYQEKSYHLLSDEEVADNKKLDKNLANRRYRASPKGKETERRYEGVPEASEGRKEGNRQYEASEGRKEGRKQYEASEGRKEGKYKASAAGNKRARELLEACDNGKRPAKQQKTNEPQLGFLAALLGGS
jgi:hypothetical protein